MAIIERAHFLGEKKLAIDLTEGSTDPWYSTQAMLFSGAQTQQGQKSILFADTPRVIPGITWQTVAKPGAVSISLTPNVYDYINGINFDWLFDTQVAVGTMATTLGSPSYWTEARISWEFKATSKVIATPALDANQRITSVALQYPNMLSPSVAFTGTSGSALSDLLQFRWAFRLRMTSPRGKTAKQT